MATIKGLLALFFNGAPPPPPTFVQYTATIPTISWSFGEPAIDWTPGIPATNWTAANVNGG